MSTIAATKTDLPTETLNVDPAHSQVGFAVEYMVGTFRGSFSPVEAKLTVSENSATQLTGSASAESVKVQDENLGTHLLSPEFFDAERAPVITFTAADVRRGGDDVTVIGELTIKGVTKPVTLTGTIPDPIQDPYGTDPIGL